MPLRQRSAVLGNIGIIPIRKPLNERMRMARLRRGNHFLVGRVRASHCNVLADRSGSQPCLLQHHTVAGAQTLTRRFADRHAVHRNPSARHVVKPHQQIDDRRLAAARRPDDRDALPRVRLQIQMLNQPLFRSVGETHVVNLDAPAYAVKLFRIQGIRRFGRLFD